MKTCLLLLFAPLLALAIVACSGDDGSGDDDDGDDVSTKYVVNELALPATTTLANKYAFDIDLDGVTENALGGVLAALSGRGLNLQASVDRNVLEGGIILLADVEATSLVAATGARLGVYLGANASPAACDTVATGACEADGTCAGVGESCGDGNMCFPCGRHLDGSGSFEVASGAPRDSLLVGNIIGGRFSGGGLTSTLTIQLSLLEGSPPITLDLVGAQAEISSVSETGLMGGRLGGAITSYDIDQVVIPAVVDVAQHALEGDCALDANSACVCTSESPGGTVQGVFDADGDCHVTEEEVRTNSIVRSVLVPDLDLYDGDLDDTLEPGVDEIKDTLSIGVGFEAVSATFTRP